MVQDVHDLGHGLELDLYELFAVSLLLVVGFAVVRFLRERMDLPFKKPITPTPTECRKNPRARSAKLRCGVKRAGIAA